MINNKPVSCRFKLISVHSTILFFKYHQLGLEGLGQFSKPEAVGCILTVFKFSLYLVHCRFQHFYYFICNCVCYTINIRFNTSLIHILQSVAASRQGGGGGGICPLIFFVPPPNIFLLPNLPPRVFSSTQAFCFSMLHYRPLNNIIYLQKNHNLRLTSIFNIGQTTVGKQHLMDLKLIS